MSLAPDSIWNGLIGVVAGCGLVSLWLKSRQDRVVTLEGEVTKLRDRTVSELERDFRAHKDSDRSQEIATKLETVISQNNEIAFEVKKLNRESAAQEATLKRNETSLNKLWGKFDDCRQAHGSQTRGTPNA